MGNQKQGLFPFAIFAAIYGDPKVFIYQKGSIAVKSASINSPSRFKLSSERSK